MEKTVSNLVLLIMFCTINLAFSQNVFEGNVELNTQIEVDDFGANNYTEISGYLRIEGNDITSLSSLSSLENIQDDLWIRNTTLLTSLTGIENIEYIHDQLWILNNSGLLNLDDISSLTNVGGFITIESNAALLSIEGLSGITSINTLKIDNNTSLINLIGLHNLVSVENHLSIINNDSLIDLFGLSNIATISHSLEIKYNDNLENLDGLGSSLTSIGYSLDVYDNNSLQNLSGLINISSVGLDLRIQDNDALQNLNGLSNITYIGDGLHIYFNPLIKSLYGLHNLTFIGEGLRVYENTSLTNLDALINITTIPNILYIYNNDSLLQIDGLSNIASIGGDLIIDDNNELVDFCGLTKVLVNDGISGSYIVVSNGFNPTTFNIINGDCSSQTPDLTLSYPKLGDYYVEGQNVRIQIESNVAIPVGTQINISYSTDDGTTWVEDGSFDNNIQSGDFWVAQAVTEPTEFLIKIKANINGNILESMSRAFTIQPVNYYEENGFLNDGVSDLHFPFQGLYDSEFGWFGINISPGHICMDKESEDWNYFNYMRECGKDFRSPLFGKIIFIENETNTNLCSNSENTDYEKQIIIQSLIDKTFAFRIAHLKEVHDSISVGDTINVGKLIGKVGGSGTTSSHAHCSLYKNIYGWQEITIDSKKTNTVLELLMNGQKILCSDCNQLCNSMSELYSAKFDFETLFENIVSNKVENLLTNEILQNFISFQYTSLNLDIIIGMFNSNVNNLRNDTSDAITSLDGLESILSIDGDLIISGTEITNLNGLKNLTHVGGNVIIEKNDYLSNFCGLFSLIENKGIGGDFIINDNLINPSSEDILSDMECRYALSEDKPNDLNGIVVYPNPTSKDIYISVKNNIEITSMQIFDITGKKIFGSIKRSRISIEGFANGLYFLKIDSTHGSITKSFIKM